SNNTNWVDGPAGTDTHQVPGSTSDVFFSANSATNLTTTLDGSYTINSLNFTSTGTTADSSNVTIANGTGTNTLTINGGGISDASTSAAHSISANVVLGADQVWSNTSTGLLTVSGSVTGVSKFLTVGGPGNTLISGAIQTISGGLTKNGTGTLIISSASNNYLGNTVVTLGTLQLGADNAIPSGTGKGNVTVNGTLDVNGHDQQINGLTGSGTIDNTAAATSKTLTVGANNQTSTFNGVIQNTGGTLAVTKTGTGALTLIGNSTYTGDTNVNAGKLVVSGSLQGNVNVAPGATLASGNNILSAIKALSVASDALGGGTLAPGDTGGPGTSTIGKLTVQGNVTLGTTLSTGVAHLSMELGGTTAGASYDQIVISGGSLNLANVYLDGSFVGGFTPTGATYDDNSHTLNHDGQVFYLITGSNLPITTTFANQGAPDGNFAGTGSPYSTITIGNQLFAISYHANFNGGASSTFESGGNDVAIMAIPEPNAMSMLAGSLGLALGLQRLRRRRS
ncbi:MAG TPA: autotransporter-associated beta strand repeat-containing protein, partial [Chthoniobacter sp.]|nr:autotransporter-associated beta strand repeat-containing protein [Chthoniobacter sp.]